MSGFIVHTVPGSPFARAVLACLEEKALPWRLAPLAPGGHRSAEHLARHPFARMPAIEHDGFALYETQAILRYIDRVQPSPPLTPADPRLAARMDQAMNVNDWYLFADCIAVIGFHRLVAPRLLGLEPDEAAIAASMPRARIVFAELSRLLADQPGFAGADISLADLLIAPQFDFIATTPEWDELTAGHANLLRWLERMRRRPSLRATAWDSLAAGRT